MKQYEEASISPHRSPSPDGSVHMGPLSLPSGTQLQPYKDKDTIRYENEFHRMKFMQSEIIVESGIVRRLPTVAKDIFPASCHASQNWLITDTIVDSLYGEQVLEGLREGGLKVSKIVVSADTCDETGESSAERHKTMAVFNSCVDQILDVGIDKCSAIISLGGGVVNNICGFLAASLYRGITLVHFSTTMMGQVDAAIDFKQAVNHHHGKNLLGAYHPASRIILDPTTLLSLSKRHMLNGLSEAIKHAITQSPELLEYILDNIDVLDGTDNDAKATYLTDVIRCTIAHKVPTLNGDTDNDYNEMLPQYGHAVGHAVEHLSFSCGGQALLHGEAIAIGMCVSAEIAHIMGVCSMDVVDEHYRIFRLAGLPVYVPRSQTLQAIVKKLSRDKHYLAKKPTMGLPVEIGRMFETDGVFGHSIEPDVLEQGLCRNVARRDSKQ